MGSAPQIAVVPAPRADAPRSPARAPRPSSTALKVTMAVTGTVFALFVLVHMIGNLKAYTGAEHFDPYAHWLRTLFEPLLPYEGMLWILRTVLLLCLLAHVGASIVLVVRARRARGRFRRTGMGWRRLPATLMPYTGLVLLVFIVVHILDLTTGTAPVAPEHFEPATPETAHAYHNLVESLSRWPMALFYIVVMVLLGLHLVHGLLTAANDFGVTGHRVRRYWALAGAVIAGAVAVGNISIPVAVLTGVVS